MISYLQRWKYVPNAIGHQTKDRPENLGKFLLEIKEWNTCKFYNLYQTLEQQCKISFLWVLLYHCEFTRKMRLVFLSVMINF